MSSIPSTSIYNKAVDASNWIKAKSTAAAASAGTTIGKVRDFIAGIFAFVGQTAINGWNLAKTNVIAAAKYVAATSPTTKACGAFALVAIFAAIAYNQMNPSATTVVTTTTKQQKNTTPVSPNINKGVLSQPQSPRQPMSPTQPNSTTTVATVQTTGSDTV